jgi:adrenodoxin-NADP+ reductase
VPFGLVRFGVAPDHAETKNVENKFNSILEDSRVNFMGNVAIGRDVTLEEAKQK